MAWPVPSPSEAGPAGCARIGVVTLGVVVGPAAYDVALGVVVLGVVAGDAGGLVLLGHVCAAFGARSGLGMACCGEHARPSRPLSAC